jgi:peptide/nickel transport system ATP-binding protein
VTEQVPLLTVENLCLEFRTRAGVVHALDGVSLTVHKGETLGIVGESGSGKSVLAYAILGILDAAGRVTRGRAVFGGLDMIVAAEEERAEVRGRELSMIFQSPRTALNPIRRVGDQIGDILRRHAALPLGALRRHAIECLAQVKIPDPARRFDAYPFELSGGMCQRVMIAMALACNPALLIADEPTTGLDVTTQAAVMDLVADLARARNMATILITHDLGLAAAYCEHIVVMHAGHVVESAPTTELFRAPHHPYTAKLIAASPHGRARLAELAVIPGYLPDLRRNDLPPCRFSARCERRRPECESVRPPLITPGHGHQVLCHHPLRAAA